MIFPPPILTILSPHTTFQGWFQPQIYPHCIHTASVFETGPKWHTSLLRFLKAPHLLNWATSHSDPAPIPVCFLDFSSLPTLLRPWLKPGLLFFSRETPGKQGQISEGQTAPYTSSRPLRSALQSGPMLICLEGLFQSPSK